MHVMAVLNFVHQSLVHIFKINLSTSVKTKDKRTYIECDRNAMEQTHNSVYLSFNLLLKFLVLVLMLISKVCKMH